MKPYLIYFVAVCLLVVGMSATGCNRGAIRSRTIWAGDHNVTVVRKPSRKAIKRSSKPIYGKRYPGVNR